jgi:hypothetical protein
MTAALPLRGPSDPAHRYRGAYMPGFDCALSTLRNTLAFYGYPFSNAMVLGLSGSFCFVYRDAISPQVPYFLLAGIAHNSVESLPPSLGSYLYKDKLSPRASLGAFFDAYLERDLPVHVAVSRPRLQSAIHGREITPIEHALDLGYHYITVVGRDARAGTYTVFETDDPRPHQISESDLWEAWYLDTPRARRGVVADLSCDGKWYAFLRPQNAQALLPDLIRSSLARAVHNFFDPYSDDSGAAGLHAWRQAALRWSDRPARELCASVLLAKAMEFNLTGGGFARKLFGRYVREASDRLSDPRLTEVARLVAETAGLWRTFVDALLEAVSFDFERERFRPDLVGLTRLVRQSVDPLAAAELRQMEALRAWTRGGNA